jgi:myosin-5
LGLDPKQGPLKEEDRRPARSLIPSDCFEKSDDGNLGNTYLISSSIPENGDSRDGVVDGVEGYRGQVIEDSPYSGNAISVEDKPLIFDEELDSVVSHLSSISASRNKCKFQELGYRLPSMLQFSFDLLQSSNLMKKVLQLTFN